jgi:folate-binding Fe-S cluster repair protein YgfZ
MHPFSIYGITLIRVAQETSTHDEGVPDDYLLHRIIHGVPEGVNDIPPMQAFPMESNMDVMGGRTFFFHIILGGLLMR